MLKFESPPLNVPVTTDMLSLPWQSYFLSVNQFFASLNSRRTAPLRLTSPNSQVASATMRTSGADILVRINIAATGAALPLLLGTLPFEFGFCISAVAYRLLPTQDVLPVQVTVIGNEIRTSQPLPVIAGDQAGVQIVLRA